MKKYPVIIIFLITMLLVCGETVMAKERWGKPLGVLANGVEDRVVISWEPVIQSKGISNEKEGHLRKVREKGGDDDSNGFNIYY